ncbi:protocadherin Fat 1-like [Paramacrobiotus metropolitanus]|uniref:protocadherin Fat 1-like n=1 Tax=Paramacrobiotus metropolitanus TaxID=2943436 RepID=UPI002445F871|nr:protocadherin Fat 1-like [Paramacrobiotus metropolitanus]
MLIRFWTLSMLCTAAVCQDCLFYNPNTTEIFTSAFLSVPEDVPTGKVIAQVDAKIVFRITLVPTDNDIVTKLFTVVVRNNVSVEIRTQEKLTSLLPHIKDLNFQLQCTGPSGSFTTLPFIITVIDINDHAPVFYDYPYEAHISEFHGVGLTVLEGVTAFDKDLPNTANTEIQYAITGGNELQYFGVPNPLEGTIILQRKLDYESGPHIFRLNITAKDGGEPPRSNYTTVTIFVIDEDDQNPVFEKDFYEATIIEETDEFKPILTVHAWDGDVGINESLKYDISDGLQSFIKHFTIDYTSGTISLLTAIDREQLPSALSGYINMIVSATQDNDPSRVAKAAVRIYVEDVNDNGPRFLESMVSKEIDLLPTVLSAPYVDLVQLTVVDQDTSDNAAFVAFIESNISQSSYVKPLMILEPNEGINQTMVIRADNLTALLEEAGAEFSLRVVALDSIRNKRTVRSSMKLPVDSMQDIASVHIKFNTPFPALWNAKDAITTGQTGKEFLSQYPVIIMIILGSLVCILLIVIAIMAVAYHSLKASKKVHPFCDATSVNSSITMSPASLCGSNESQA